MLNSFSNIYRGKRVFVTGNTGFKGSWLTIWLKELGAEVYGYALPPKTEKDNFAKCKLDEQIDQTYADIRDLDKLKTAINKVNPEFVFHLAAQALVIDSYNDPIYTFQTNIIGTANVMEACKTCTSLKAMVVITSDKCYENVEQLEGYVEDDTLGGKDPYSASKACAEIVARSMKLSFYGDTDIRIATTRAGNVIGGGDWSENRLIPDIFKQIEKGKSVFIRNPKATRPWEHVLEPLSGYLLLGQKLVEDKTFEGPWNFGPETDEHFSVHDIVKEIEKHSPLQYEVATEVTGFHEAGLLQLDITKAKTRLGWKTQLNFDKTIKFTCDGYAADLDNNVDLYQERVNQIAEYTSIAKEKHVIWI